MSVDDDGWIEGGAIVGFHWASTGTGLLVQQDERVRFYDLGEKLVETASQDLDRREVIGLGHTNEAWWLLVKESGQVRFRPGLGSEGVLLEGANAGAISSPAVSPDGRTLACADSDLTVTFWKIDTGRRLFGFRVEVEGYLDDIFDAPKIVQLAWSGDSRYLAVRLSFPAQEITVIDVPSRRFVGTVP